MKKVGKQTLLLTTSETNSRNGESSFARLSDGRIMHAYTEYLGASRDDHAAARISACYSSDEGETWTKPEVLIEKPENSLNIMCANLINLANGELGLLYLDIVALPSGYQTLTPKYCYSCDDGKTWSEAVSCVDEVGYFLVNNHRVIQQKSGRLLVPIAYHGNEQSKSTKASFRLTCSDDNGRTWKLMDIEIKSPYNDRIGFQEPGIFELDDGRLWAYFRTEYGHQWQSFSSDDGKTWTEPRPNFLFTSPNSPMLIAKVKDYVISIFNPLGFSCVNDRVWHSETACGRPMRTPFICAISCDGGKSFDTTDKTFRPSFASECVYIEDDLNEGYCYPAVIETKDGFLVSYYFSNGCKDNCLNCCKVTKVTWDELQDILK